MSKTMRSPSANHLTASLLLLALCYSTLAAKEENAKEIFDSVSAFAHCFSQATFSFFDPISYPPKSEAELKTLCKSQAEGLKCLKEKTKGTMPLLRRGTLAFSNTRSKHHRKICTNTASSQSRRFIEASKCLMEKRFNAYRANDADLLQTLHAIARKNYNDSVVELKQLCCSFYFYKQNFTELAGPECAQYRADFEEMGNEVATRDLEILCDDDEKLSKSCSKLERIQFERKPNYKPDERVHATSLVIYLIATLGEPNTDPNFKI